MFCFGLKKEKTFWLEEERKDEEEKYSNNNEEGLLQLGTYDLLVVNLTTLPNQEEI